MGFSRSTPITAGTVLIRSDIRSQNYVAGTSGWIIEADGDAEFNNVNVRGDLLVTGNNNSYIHIYTAALGGGVNAALYEYSAGKYSDNAYPDPGIGQILATTNVLPDHYGQLTISSPLSGVAAATIQMHGGTEEAGAGGTDDTRITVTAEATVFTGLISVGTHVFNNIYGYVGDGTVDCVGITNPSASITTTETVVATSNTITFKAGRAYKVTMGCALTFSAVPNRAVSRLRKTGTAGQQLGLCGHPGSNTGTGAASGNWTTVFYVGATDVTCELVWTGIINNGAITVTYNGAGDSPRFMEISDFGEAFKVQDWGGPQLV